MSERVASSEDGSGSLYQMFELIDRKGDLFSCAETDSLTHCVSADMHMGKGIAVQFKRRFGGDLELKKQGQKPGGLAVLNRDERFIYYLVTKERYFHKPTYAVLKSSLVAMRDHCVKNNVRRICMPRIGCGLDQLQWTNVADIIKDVFSDTDIVIAVYTL